MFQQQALNITASIKTVIVYSKYSQQDTLQVNLPFEILIFSYLKNNGYNKLNISVL